jgi:hypothetical protein
MVAAQFEAALADEAAAFEASRDPADQARAASVRRRIERIEAEVARFRPAPGVRLGFRERQVNKSTLWPTIPPVGLDPLECERIGRLEAVARAFDAFRDALEAPDDAAAHAKAREQLARIGRLLDREPDQLGLTDQERHELAGLLRRLTPERQDRLDELVGQIAAARSARGDRSAA